MILRSLRVGLFLMVRYIRRGNRWASILIVAIMFLTFLNVVVVRGILVGLPVGASMSYSEGYAGDILITPHADERHIDRSQTVERTVERLPSYAAHTARYVASGLVQANYERPVGPSLLPDQVGASIVGIDPGAEDRVTGLSRLIVEGSYLSDEDTTAVLVGSQLLERYAGDVPESGGTPETSGTLSDVFPGDRIRITLNGEQGEYLVAGIVQGKVGENTRRVFMHDRQLQKVVGRSADKKDEIAVRLVQGSDSTRMAALLQGLGVDAYGIVQTARQAQGSFLDDIEATFEALGTGIGFIGIVVAAITVFIVIFIVALNRQKEIGILKGIGIDRLAIESSYVFLSMAYATLGIALGVAVLYLVIAPYVDAHPIDFPFADGVLVAPWDDTLVRSAILIVTTVLAGYLPARMIVQKNTINAILGR